MMLRKFRKEDYDTICSWYDKRGHKAPSIETLSDMGWIADERVAGWLYTTNSNMAMIEGIIANPDTTPSLRRESVERLVSFMIDVSLGLGFTQIFGITRNERMVGLCKKLGFKESIFRVMLLSEEVEELPLPDEHSIS